MKTKEEKKETRRQAKEQAQRWLEGKDEETIPDVKDVKIQSI